MRVGERAQPLVEAGAVVMALPLVGAETMWVRPPVILVLLLPMLLAAVLRHSLLIANSYLGPCVGCIYAPDKVNPNIFQFYFDFPDIFHHTSMHPLFRNIYDFYLIFYDFISPFIIYQNYLYLRRHFLFDSIWCQIY